MVLHPVRNLGLGVLLAGAACAASLAGTYTVTNTADDGPGSLRRAITDANADPYSTVVFAIGTGHQTIQPLSPLPRIVVGTIDGRSQPGYSGAPLIEIDCSQLPTVSSCMGARWGWIDSLVVNSSPWLAVELNDGGGVRRSYLGTDVTGTVARPNAFGVATSRNTVVGGYRPGEGNVISGNVTGVWMQVGGPVFVMGNRIGTDPSGMIAVPNEDGIHLTHRGAQIGGPTSWYGNLISGNTQYGIYISGTIDDGTSVIENNVVGLDAAGGTSLPEQRLGILLAGSSAFNIRRNAIADQWEAGIALQYDSVNDRLSQNLIFGNGFGIDLGYDPGSIARTQNDPEDSDAGANELQNFPTLVAGTASGGLLTVSGALNSAPDASYDVEVFATKPNTAGQTFVGTLRVTTDSNGNASFGSTLVADVQAGDGLTATATDAAGNTSELSDPVPAIASTVQVASLSPSSGPASGGTAVTIAGAGFQATSSVVFNATAASLVVFNGPTEIVATSPALEPGSVSPVIVTNGDLTTGGIASGFFADFLDVPQGDPFHDAVEELVRGGIAVGCGAGNYCSAASVTRAQVAVFLLKAEHGKGWVPPPCRGLFADVACPSPFSDWIERLADEGIAGGCGGGNYCPNDAVRRDQMAPFLLKTEHGTAYVPPACAGVFSDVPCPSLFADWIEQLVTENVTAGCGGGDYCPDAPNTRGQMAVFLTKTFPTP
ncbi:MAG TPA: IPT/TIG domain-containing protein [Thermoanaerobaculia bacterium]|jgi:hypothetical protein|nr:IPT/TIG domain-containing protein [Thermoanaerobaculia bacterium]